MTIQNPATIEERLNRALDEISQLQEVVSELAANSKHQEELLAELSQAWADSTGNYYSDHTIQSKEEGQTGRRFSEHRAQKERINGELTELYKQFEQVQGFAVGEYLDEIRVYVLLQMDSYNGLLIERLTNAEAVLEDNFPAFSLMIRHIPVGDMDLTSYLSDRGGII